MMANRKAAYHRIVDDFKLKISNLDLVAHNALPSEKEICESYKVSRSTVRKALAQLEQDNLIYRKAGVGTFVQEPLQNSKLKDLDVYIDLPFHVSGSSYYNVLFTKVQEAAVESGCCRLLSIDNSEFELPDSAKALLVTHAHPDNYPKLEAISRKIPVIVFNRLNVPQTLNVIGVDYRKTSFDIINRFIKNGCDKIMLVGDSQNSENYTTFERGSGYRQAFSSNQREVNKDLIITLEESYELSNIVNKIKKTKPDVIYISSEDLIGDALMALELTKKDVDKEISIFCFDDITLNPRLNRYNISCFKMPLFDMCQEAFRYITNYYQGEDVKVERKIFHVQTIINNCPFII